MTRKIMLVEDDNTTSAIIKKYVSKLGYSEIDAVSTGEEAIKRIAGNPPEIIIMDITLDGQMDGIDSAKYINSTYDIPVIYITSSSEVETFERIKETNPFGYILKPVDRHELKASIDMALLRHRMEKKLKDNEDRFSTILNSIGDAVIVVDSSGNINYMNPIAEFMTEQSFTNMAGKKIDSLLHIENEMLQNLKENKADPLRQGRGYNFLVTGAGKKIPVEYSISPRKNKKGKSMGSVMVIRDISERFRSEERLDQSFRQLRKAMGGIIQAMAQTVETRDPYTAGHQRRVSDLARTIAEEMKLPSDKIEGIRMASVIHDLGKISIPAEILSKPGRISDIEYSLIKCHPQTGYDILKTIDFPWPVADIVHQHHERIDGSGYPLGLGAENILIESKVLAVADVVEAMASHRPYRAALGIDLALNEITVHRGVFYDNDVVDACERVFRVNGYSMN